MANPPRTVPVGTVFNNWTVLEILPPLGGHTFCTVQCVCGFKKTLKLSIIRTGASKSCGCFRVISATSHGFSKSRTYNIWSGMIQRTSNPLADSWENYGGRGITIDPDWLAFENFLGDMGEAPEGLELDRRDNNLGYNKGNCQWVTHKKNSQNRRTSVYLDYKGEKLTISEIADLLGINYSTLQSRYKRGFTGKKLFKT